MAVLLLAPSMGALDTNSVAKTLSAIAVLGEVDVLVCDENPEPAQEAARFAGVRTVYTAPIAHGLAEPIAELMHARAKDYTHIVTPATSYGKNILPRLAGLLDVMVLSDVTKIIDTETFVRPIYAGNALQTVRMRDEIKLFSVRATGFDSAAQSDQAAPIKTLEAPKNTLSSFIEDRFVKSDRPDLASAKIVVSGGRGVGSKENFALIEQLADVLGAAVGASRAAVDYGMISSDAQVGQTGKIVAPDLYIAVGISGAIQHMAGMKDSRVIVAINKDTEAPIFNIADYGLEGDLFEIVPALIEALQA